MALALSAAVVALCTSPPARAEEGAAVAIGEAEEAALFERGLRAFDGGDGAGAALVWEDLLARGAPEKSWRVLYNLGLAYELAGRRADAVERFDAFARKVGEQPGTLPIEYEGRRQDAVERATKLRPTLSLLRVNPPASGERVSVTLPGKPARDAGFASYLEPGRYRVAMGEGTRRVEIELSLRAGEMQTVVARQLPPPPPPPPPPYHPPIPIGVLVAGGVGTVASVALPIALTLRAGALRDEAAALPTFDPGYAAARDAYAAARIQALATWSVPAGLGAATLALIVVDLVDASSSRATPAPRVGLSLGPAGIGLQGALF